MVFIEDAVVANALVRQALVAAEEIMGDQGFHTVLRLAGLERYLNGLPPDDLQPAVRTSEYARFNEAVENFYGRGGRSILRRIGRASFHHTLSDQSVAGITGFAIKLLPQKLRIHLALAWMIKALQKTDFQMDARVEQTPDGKLAYIEHSCAVCYGRQSAQPICHLNAGTVSEAVRWATGVEYELHETHCIARGDEYCRFEIGDPVG
jgi:predicted hydrocarbon binding protein